MRPVNLIPSEDRVGARRPMRSGPLAYIVVGALVAALVGVSVLVVTGNQISDSKAEIVRLEEQTASAEAKALELAAYTQFHSVREQRTATITSLADSRFDWERVMRELSLVLPSDVWLTNLTGTASPAVTPDGASSIGLRAAISGPALELVGCARSQDAVAGFVADAEGDRRRHPSRRPGLLAGRPHGWGRRRLRNDLGLPDAQFHRPVPGGRRLRRGAGGGRNGGCGR